MLWMNCVLAVTWGASALEGQVTVFLDYTNFQVRLNEATSNAGVANFSAGEVALIQTNILDSLTFAYGGYQINFTTTNPGGVFETLHFGLTGGGYGLADRIDFGNQFGDDLGRVFTANFDDFLEVGDGRGTQIAEISTSLAGTAAHELGHNLGLEHRDSYGIAGLGIADSGGGHFTGGLQNNHLMATGITGLSEAEREVQRTFSDLSHVKLEYGNGVVNNPLSMIAEQAGDHSTAGTAQALDFSDLSTGLSGFDQAAVVDGFLASGELDFFSFSLNSGDFLSVQVISSVLFNSDIDSLLTLYDTDGLTELISNDDTLVSSTSVNQGGSTYSNDSSIWNFQAPEDGTWYLRVSAISANDSGLYNLLLARTYNVVPEPGYGLLAAILVGSGAVRRRRTSVQRRLVQAI